MDKQLEETFVRTFVLRIRRERALFELNSKKKRWKFLHRLAHTFDQVFDSRFLHAIPPPNSNPDRIHAALKKRGAATDCYILIYGDERDGTTMKLDEALRQFMGRGPVVLICSPDKLAYFEAEPEAYPPPRFFLVKR